MEDESWTEEQEDEYYKQLTEEYDRLDFNTQARKQEDDERFYRS